MRKVKILISNSARQLDEVINRWIKDNGFELLDVRLVCNFDAKYGISQYTATVIYIDRSEE